MRQLLDDCFAQVSKTYIIGIICSINCRLEFDREGGLVDLFLDHGPGRINFSDRVRKQLKLFCKKWLVCRDRNSEVAASCAGVAPHPPSKIIDLDHLGNI